MKQKLKKLLNLIFICCFLLISAVALAKAVLLPKDVNEYENRSAYKLKVPTLAAYMDGSYQSGFEDALNDQLPFAQTVKKSYNDFSSRLVSRCMEPFLAAGSKSYVSFMNNRVFGGDYIVYLPRKLAGERAELEAKIENINAYIAGHPEIEVYLYYIEKDVDINLVTGEKLGAYEFLAENLDLPAGRTAKFPINNFDEYSRYFFKTDHHWNYLGSYLGYTQVMELLGNRDILSPEEAVVLPYTFSGSKANTGGIDAVFSEGFTAYRFSYPNMTISSNGSVIDDYGSQSVYFSQKAESISYGSFYGGDLGEIVFDTHSPAKENILVIGESYDNAILKLLASSYNKTFSVDLRNYEALTGHPFHMAQYMEENNITKVLLIGSLGFFTLDTFNLAD